MLKDTFCRQGAHSRLLVAVAARSTNVPAAHKLANPQLRWLLPAVKFDPATHSPHTRSDEMVGSRSTNRPGAQSCTDTQLS